MNLKIKALLSKNRELITYGIFGVATTLVNMAIYYLLMLIPFFKSELSVSVLDKTYEVGYLLANATAFLGAVIFSYIVNRRYVFQNKVSGRAAVTRQFLSFLGTRLVSFGIEEVLMFVLVEKALVGEYIVKWPVAVIVVVLNYVFGKLIVFRKPKAREEKGK